MQKVRIHLHNLRAMGIRFRCNSVGPAAIFNGDILYTMRKLRDIRDMLLNLGFKKIRYNIEGYESDFVVFTAEYDFDYRDGHPINKYNVEIV